MAATTPLIQEQPIQRARGSPGWVRAGASVRHWLPALGLCCAIGSLLAWCVVEFCAAPNNYWNDARLAATVAMAHGYALYYPADQGPILNHIYGPLGALYYWPATWVGTPTRAILLGCVLSLAGYLLPAAWLLFRGANDRRSLGAGGCALVLFLFATVTLPPLRMCAFEIKVDAPALCMVGLAAVLLDRRPAPPGWQRLLLAAACAALGMACKQSMVLVPAALGAYLWIAHDRRVAFHFLLFFAASAAAVALGLALTFDMSAMWFNAVSIPAHQPFYQELLSNAPGLSGKMLSLLGAVAWMVEATWPVLVLLGFSLLSWERFFAGSFARRIESLSANPAFLATLIWLSILPLSILGAAKVGGFINNFGLPGYFALLGTAAFVKEVLCRPAVPAARLFQLAVACFVVGVALQLPSKAYQAMKSVKQADQNNTEQAFRYVRAHPGEVYFAAQPLVHLLAEGRLYHFYYAILDRDYARFPVTPEHFRAGMPESARRIASRTHDISLKDFVHRHAPSYDQQEDFTELRGWEVFRKVAAEP